MVTSTIETFGQIDIVGNNAGAIIVSISTLSNFVGRLSFGVIYDKFGSYIALLINLIMTISALLLMTVATNMPSLFSVSSC
ncbi:MFS transporter [Peribacillus butanolivorans]|uniref:hypothetical protein n=1 Tax=Peribacillus butanolivorans TaxID=421767 RepID=UPI003666712C